MIDQQEAPHLISAHGGYRELQSYQMAEIVYGATDQMVQAARSGKQNYVWGVNSRCFIPGSGLFQT